MNKEKIMEASPFLKNSSTELFICNNSSECDCGGCGSCSGGSCSCGSGGGECAYSPLEREIKLP